MVYLIERSPAYQYSDVLVQLMPIGANPVIVIAKTQEYDEGRRDETWHFMEEPCAGTSRTCLASSSIDDCAFDLSRA
jgi:hypothetical protein